MVDAEGITSPVFIVCANGEVLAFESTKAASSWVESVDVEAGEYPAAFDATGKRLSLIVEKPTSRRKLPLLPIELIQSQPVKVVPKEREASGAGDLRAALAKALGAGEGVPDGSAPLTLLVQLAFERLRLR